MRSVHRINSARTSAVIVSDRTVWRMVALTTDTGLTGVGEATLEGVGDAFARRLSKAANELVGCDIVEEDACAILQNMRQDLTERTIRSALSQALCDLAAQIADRSIAAYLGAEPPDRRITLYANVNRATKSRNPEAFAANARAAASEGFGAIKLAPFDGLMSRLCETDEGKELIEAGLKRIRAVADAVPSCDIMVDCHWRFSPDAATALIDPLAEIGVTWLECPLTETRDAIRDLKALRTATNRRGIRLAGLETAGAWDDVGPFVGGGAYDVIMPDVKHAGSLQTILDVGKKAQAAGVSVSLHNPAGPIAHLCSTHVMAVLGGAEKMEVQWRESPLFFKLTDPAPSFENGACRPGRDPGLAARLIISAPEIRGAQ